MSTFLEGVGGSGNPLNIPVANQDCIAINSVFRFIKLLSITPSTANIKVRFVDGDSQGAYVPMTANPSQRADRYRPQEPWKQLFFMSDTANTLVDFIWSLDDHMISDPGPTGGGAATLTVIDVSTGDPVDANASQVILTNPAGTTFGEALNAVGFSTIIQEGPPGIYPDAGFRTWLNNGPLAKAVQVMGQNNDDLQSYAIGGDYTGLAQDYALWCSMYCNDQVTFVANPVPGLAYDAVGISSGSDAPIISPGFNSYDTSDTGTGTGSINSVNFQVWRIVITSTGVDPLSFLDPGGIALNIYPAAGGGPITTVPGGTATGTVYYVNTAGVTGITPTSASTWAFHKGEGPFPFIP